MGCCLKPWFVCSFTTLLLSYNLYRNRRRFTPYCSTPRSTTHLRSFKLLSSTLGFFFVSTTPTCTFLHGQWPYCRRWSRISLAMWPHVIAHTFFLVHLSYTTKLTRSNCHTQVFQCRLVFPSHLVPSFHTLASRITTPNWAALPEREFLHFLSLTRTTDASSHFFSSHLSDDVHSSIIFSFPSFVLLTSYIWHLYRYHIPVPLSRASFSKERTSSPHTRRIASIPSDS